MMDRVNAFLGTVLADRRAALEAYLRRDNGQAFVEYALVLVIIAVVIGAALTWDPLVNAIQGAIDDVADRLGQGDGG